MSAPARLFVDLDGVLADYYAGICRVFGVDPPWPFRCPLGDWNFFVHPPLNRTTAEVAPHMGRDFYADLALLPDAREIVARAEAMVGPKNVFFLSSPWDTPGCDEGKRAWVREHFPAYARRTLIGACKEACAHPGSVLLDDSAANCAAFIAEGGKAVLLPRPWNSRHALCCHDTGRVVDLAAVFDF